MVKLENQDIQFLAQAVVTATKVFNPETTAQSIGFYSQSAAVLKKLQEMVEEEKEASDD